MGVRAGGSYENDNYHSIKSGQLILRRKEICAVFDDVIGKIKQSCHKLVDNRSVKVWSYIQWNDRTDHKIRSIYSWLAASESLHTCIKC
jgi:hypothetical protein